MASHHAKATVDLLRVGPYHSRASRLLALGGVQRAQPRPCSAWSMPCPGPWLRAGAAWQETQKCLEHPAGGGRKLACTSVQHSLHACKHACAHGLYAQLAHSLYAQLAHSLHACKHACAHSLYAQLAHSLHACKHACAHGLYAQLAHSLHACKHACAHGLYAQLAHSLHACKHACAHSLYAQLAHSLHRTHVHMACTRLAASLSGLLHQMF